MRHNETTNRSGSIIVTDHNALRVCTVCRSIDTEPILASRRTVAYRYCNRCKCAYLSDYSLIDTNKYTDDYLGETKFTQDMILKYASLFGYLEDSVAIAINDQKGSFLEIGFGNPGVLISAAHSGFNCTGIDMSLPKVMENTLNAHSIRTIKGDFREVEINGLFNVIWMSHFVEHFDPQDLMENVINKAAKLLDPNGVMIIISPDASLYGTKDDEMFYGNCKEDEHYVIYHPDSFHKLIMDELGFTRYWKTQYIDGTEYHTRGEWRMAFGKQHL